MTNEKVSFQMISLAGDAFSKLVEALRLTRSGDEELSKQRIEESEKLMNEAHNLQTQLIVKEARGEDNKFSVLLIHAQDTLMNTILMSTITNEMIEMYKSLKNGEIANEK